MIKIKDIRLLSKEEIETKINDLKKDLFDLNFKRRYGKVEKPHLFSQARKDIARMKTVLKEKQNGKAKKDS